MFHKCNIYFRTTLYISKILDICPYDLTTEYMNFRRRRKTVRALLYNREVFDSSVQTSVYEYGPLQIYREASVTFLIKYVKKKTKERKLTKVRISDFRLEPGGNTPEAPPYVSYTQHHSWIRSHKSSSGKSFKTLKGALLFWMVVRIAEYHMMCENECHCLCSSILGRANTIY